MAHEWIRKLWYTYTMEYYSAIKKNTFESVLMRWMKLEPISALGRPKGMVWGGRREEGSGWATHVYLWRIHVDIWQNQYNVVKLNKIKLIKI